MNTNRSDREQVSVADNNVLGGETEGRTGKEAMSNFVAATF